MRRGYIGSLIRRWSAYPQNHSGREINGRDPLSPENGLDHHADAAREKQVTAFWHDAIRFVALDDLIKAHPRAAELDFDQAAAGHLPATLPDSQSGKGTGTDDDEGHDVFAVIGLAPNDWARLKGRSRQASYLLAIPARLTHSRYLLPKPNEAPFFNPARIQSNDWRNDVFITTGAIVTEWVNAHPLPNIQEWPPLWSYALTMLAGAIFQPAAGIDAAKDLLAAALGLTQKQDWIIKIVQATAADQATDNIASVYKYLLEPDEQPGSGLRTYRRLISGCRATATLAGPEASLADTEVFGHIDSFRITEGTAAARRSREIFPLDPSQRQAVRHACRLQDGEILAVNGPPGTGKTATLRAVIASYWIRAALTAEHPPIIVGCGATNQAVTNITEAFIEAPHKGNDYQLARRWNPLVSSYGMFFASSSYADKNPDKIVKYQGFQKSFRIHKDRCLFTLREGRNPFSPSELPDLTTHYLRQASECPEIRCSELPQILAKLRAQLRRAAIELPNYLRRLTILASGGSRCDLRADDLIQAQVLPLIRRQNKFVQDAFDTLAAYTRNPSPEHLRDLIADADCNEAEAARLLVESVIDGSLRPHAFHLAARYWEGRFLEVSAGRLYTRSEENVEKALRRICMLAPCIVSTINRVPHLFKVEAFDPEKTRHFAYGLADLLIMDESGQAVPEAGAACFALTKRALIVGDLRQLEPVPSVQLQNEVALLSRQDVDRDSFHNYLIDTFKAPSCGSILGMAQRASSYHDRFENGLTLLFHYRCVKPIIDYCNTLSYGNSLKAKTGSGEGQWPPPLAWVSISDPAVKRRGSWANDREAREIADWLRSAWPRIQALHGKTATIGELVAVLSAFRPQIDSLRNAIRQAFSKPPADLPLETVWPTESDILELTIGTVHSLQGAERPIVVFSGTVSSDTGTVPFFDTSPNILNVAVSRAKKSFIFFGDTRHLFGPDHAGIRTSGKPSAILGRHMRGPLARRLYPRFLVIVEAPGKIQAIADILGKDYEIFATGGSIREIDDGELGLGFDRGLRPRWKWREGPGKRTLDDFAALAREIDSYKAVYIATDADMEGEAIAWHVADVLAGIAGPQVWAKIKRVRLGNITRKALTEAFAAASPDGIDRNIAGAAIARAIADRLIANHFEAEVNRTSSATESAQEVALGTPLRQLTVPGKRQRTARPRPGRVQAGVLRLVFDAAQRDLEAINRLGRFRINAAVPLGPGILKGRLVLPDREYRINAVDEDAARERLKASLSRLPSMLDGYEHDGLDQVTHALGLPPFLSTIELMRRAVRYRLMPWNVMEALQNLYLGRIMPHDYLGEIEE